MGKCTGAVLTQENLDEEYHVNMAVSSGETMAEISFIEDEVLEKTMERRYLDHKIEVLNMDLLLKKEKLRAKDLVLSIIEKGGIEYLRKKTA